MKWSWVGHVEHQDEFRTAGRVWHLTAHNKEAWKTVDFFLVKSVK